MVLAVAAMVTAMVMVKGKGLGNRSCNAIPAQLRLQPTQGMPPAVPTCLQRAAHTYKECSMTPPMQHSTVVSISLAEVACYRVTKQMPVGCFVPPELGGR